MKFELKPCRCGNTELTFAFGKPTSAPNIYWRVLCQKCNLSTEWVGTKYTAARNWNALRSVESIGFYAKNGLIYNSIYHFNQKERKNEH